MSVPRIVLTRMNRLAYSALNESDSVGFFLLAFSRAA